MLQIMSTGLEDFCRYIIRTCCSAALLLSRFLFAVATSWKDEGASRSEMRDN